MSETPLEQRKCQPCEGIGSPMSAEDANAQIAKVEGWALSEDGKWISRKFVAKNFVAAVEFIQKVCDVAESDDHHPDVHLTGYRNLKIDLSTHAIGGLSENDFILAAKINELELTE